MNKFFAMVLLVCGAACAQEHGSKLSLQVIEESLRDGHTPVAVINRQIQEHGVNFAATEEVHQELNQLGIKPQTWQLILKYAPVPWEPLRRSPPHIHQIVAAGGVLMAADYSNQISRSVDHGDHWSSFPVPDANVKIQSLAFCGAFWVAGGRSQAKSSSSFYEKYSLFISTDGQSWIATQTGLSNFEDHFALACNG